MDDIEELRRKLREEQRRREEAESRASEEQCRREEEQRRREAAEELAAASQPNTLQQYLEACHSLHLAIQVITDPTMTTQGDTTNPTGRIFPKEILPWGEFSTRQEEIWDSLSHANSFCEPGYPSTHQMEYVQSFLNPISSEIGLRDYERDAVENAVQRLVERAYADPILRSSLGLRGTVKFESHTNLGIKDDILSGPMEQMSLDGTGPTEPMSKPMSTPKPAPAPKPREHRKARGMGNRADQFVISQASDGQLAPVLAIEYKAPHKMGIDQVITGLESEIQPERDVINKDSQGFAFSARRLIAAVITQLFSYMIGKGVRYGYVCTGQTYVFLYIEDDDPSKVYVSACVPNQDVMDDDETRLHRTAVAQVFAFILQALRAEPTSSSWHDKAAALGLWAVEFDDILMKIPETDRKPEPRASPYKPQRWKGFKRTPIRTRSRCQPQNPGVRRPEEDDEPPSPTPPSRTGGKAVPSKGTSSGGGGKQGQRQGKQEQNPATKPNIKSRPFCTQNCLLGLAHGGPMDKNCPNADCHGREHISRLDFLQLIRDQLAKDRGHDADCMPLYLSGSRGSLFKARLSSHGYTLVAKGVEGLDLACLQNENEMYDRLQPIQGKHVPVCIGSIDLVLPYYYDCGVYVHFMFLSWAGRPLWNCVDQAIIKSDLDNALGTMLKAVHKLRVLHRDAELRNVLYNADSGKFMLVDFERAEYRGRQPLGSIVPNVQGRERNRGPLQKQQKRQKQQSNDFARELSLALGGAARYARNLPSPAG